MKSLSILVAVLALSGAADAKPKTQIVSLNGHCDVLTLKINKTNVVGIDDPSCETGIGVGYVGKVKGFGTGIIAGAQFGTAPGTQFVIRLSYPLVTGGNWDIYVTTNGTTMSKFESGTYTVQGTADKGLRGATPLVSAHH
ncbi:MAG TPA: hypothetical protein VMF58_18700 [Rhizomicrobium sp.]|nr:hypothetical protein [Rhizomicrobium sp.]